ncbi:phospholipid carrier-dependent glycosyltransferase [Myceligenerans crystallogenes]|uniref:Polyprenol-phosphate-mannose--protein mannosyltransferase n=2 Tax=Myceligenerans crystallogenes TaxID=316335 RepID=A0ABP4ZNU7_9MICO
MTTTSSGAAAADTPDATERPDTAAALPPENPDAPPVPGGAPAPPRPAADDRSTRDRLLEKLLGARRLGLGTTARDRMWDLIGTLAVVTIAAVARLWELGRPAKLVFDETYYVKEGWSLASLGYEAAWPEEPNPAFEAGDVSSYKTGEAEYVVHPPVGKWMIALGMRLTGGADDPWKWRIASAVVGILAVLLVIRIARRMFGWTSLGLMAGLLLAVDGEAIVHSRTGLLDQFLMFWVLVAFACLVMDREWGRRRLAERVAHLIDSGSEAVMTYGPRIGFRWWRLAAAVSLGLACGVKWSGLYFVLGFGLLVVFWDLGARRDAGIRRWVEDGALGVLVTALVMLPTIVVVYIATWTGWFVNRMSYMRDWAEVNGQTAPGWFPGWADGVWNAGRSLGEYHKQMWDFHTSLESDHSYDAHPVNWIVQGRPTSFFWEKFTPGQGPCPPGATQDCAVAVTSLGNPALWWLGAATLLVALVLALVKRDWRGSGPLMGVAAGWLPWFQYSWPIAGLLGGVARTIFTFYSIVFAPFLVLTIVYVVAALLDYTENDPPAKRAIGWVAGVVTAVIVGVGVLFYPIWTAMPVPYDYWHGLMWLPSWI